MRCAPSENNRVGLIEICELMINVSSSCVISRSNLYIETYREACVKLTAYKRVCQNAQRTCVLIDRNDHTGMSTHMDEKYG